MVDFTVQQLMMGLGGIVVLAFVGMRIQDGLFRLMAERPSAASLLQKSPARRRGPQPVFRKAA